MSTAAAAVVVVVDVVFKMQKYENLMEEMKGASRAKLHQFILIWNRG